MGFESGRSKFCNQLLEVGGLVVFPIVLIYTAAVFWIFRGKVGKVAPEYGA